MCRSFQGFLAVTRNPFHRSNNSTEETVAYRRMLVRIQLERLSCVSEMIYLTVELNFHKTIILYMMVKSRLIGLWLKYRSIRLSNSRSRDKPQERLCLRCWDIPTEICEIHSLVRYSREVLSRSTAHATTAFELKTELGIPPPIAPQKWTRGKGRDYRFGAATGRDRVAVKWTVTAKPPIISLEQMVRGAIVLSCRNRPCA